MRTFLNVSRPSQATQVGGGHQAAVSHFYRDIYLNIDINLCFKINFNEISM